MCNVPVSNIPADKRNETCCMKVYRSEVLQIAMLYIFVSNIPLTRFGVMTPKNVEQIVFKIVYPIHGRRKEADFKLTPYLVKLFCFSNAMFTPKHDQVRTDL